MNKKAAVGKGSKKEKESFGASRLIIPDSLKGFLPKNNIPHKKSSRKKSAPKKTKK